MELGDGAENEGEGSASKLHEERNEDKLGRGRGIGGNWEFAPFSS